MARKKKKVLRNLGKFLKEPRKDLSFQKRLDIDPQHSTKSGFAGLYETALRRFKTVIYTLTLLPVYFLGSVCIGLALVPGILFFESVHGYFRHEPSFIKYPAWGIAIAISYFLYGFTLIFLIPALNKLLRTTPRPCRGVYYSIDFLKWFVHNSLTYIVRYTFLEFITPTPFNLLFFKMMGMKIGRGTQINSSHISDPGLIELGVRATIGGSATICAHYGMGGFLVIAPVKIGNDATIGLRATILGGVEIGDHAKVMPNSVVLPKTIIPAGETWGGVPAVKIQPKTEPSSS